MTAPSSPWLAELRRVLGDQIAEMVDAGVRAGVGPAVDAHLGVAPWPIGGQEEMVREAVQEMVAEECTRRARTAVQEAVSARFPVPSAGSASVSPEGAAAAIVERLEAAHELDLGVGDLDTRERLAAKFGPSILEHGETLSAVDAVLEADRGAHAVARHVLQRDLEEAFALPESEREERVRAVLDAERKRVKARAGTRAARATRILLESVRLVA